MRTNTFATLALTAGLAVGSPALAADIYEPLPAPAPEPVIHEHGLDWTIVPFNGWLPGMTGTIGALGNTASVDLSPIDIIENLDTFVDVLDGLYIGTGHVGFDRFGMMYDVFYLDVSATRAFGPDIIGANLDVGFSELMVTLAPTYRVYETQAGFLDALAGVRIYDISAEVDTNLIGATGGGSWIDPIIGVSGRYNFNERWYVNGWGMIGGFGVGSDFTWDVWGNVGYEWHDGLDVYAGFRATGADYTSGGFTWDITQYGPVAGFALKF